MQTTKPRTRPPTADAQFPLRSARKLGEILLTSGVIQQDALARALDVQQMGGGRLGAILVNLGICSEAQLRSALREQFDVEVVELAEVIPDGAVLDMLPVEAIRKFEVIPLKREGPSLWIALLDPYNAAALHEIRSATGCTRLVVTTCTEGDFNAFLTERLETQSLIQQIFEEGEFYRRAIESLAPEEPEPAADTNSPKARRILDLKAKQAPVITFCNFLLVQAIRKRASDIHLEPYESFVRVRLRVDGRMHTLLTPPRRLHEPAVSRFKVMADMDISKKLVPQDGHISVFHARDNVHFRVSTLPTVHGEKCVVRLLEREHSLSSLERLGMEPEALDFMQSIFAAPQGMILATGPTGSGKTTTLHAGLAGINDHQVNIVTLEDPVESTIPGINHVQINERAGLTFASGLRSVLRQDPDVVFVGEMRDAEVADIAVKAALTGHLVLTTLHTNGAVESLVRLEDMGVPRYLVADGLLAIVAQRLLRRVCSDCVTQHLPNDEEQQALQLDRAQAQQIRLSSGGGCDGCVQSGYRGRVAVYEILRGTPRMREMIRKGAATGEIARQAVTDGMTPLYQAGLQKVQQGVTTLEEVRRVLYRVC